MLRAEDKEIKEEKGDKIIDYKYQQIETILGIDEIGTILKKRRKELSLTMAEVAEKVGVSEATISRWESGDIVNMKRNRMVDLSKALKISPNIIIGYYKEDDNFETFKKIIDKTEDLEKYYYYFNKKRIEKIKKKGIKNFKHVKDIFDKFDNYEKLAKYLDKETEVEVFDYQAYAFKFHYGNAIGEVEVGDLSSIPELVDEFEVFDSKQNYIDTLSPSDIWPEK
jgi:transcriptional regulator with XRE-family HTH domain